MVLHESTMNKFLSHLYQTGVEKVSSQNEITLDDISAADLIAAANEGLIDLNDYINTEKTASESSFEDFSDEELMEALALIEEQEKTASVSDDDLYWQNAGAQMALGYQNQMQKIASEEEEFDLNELSVEEFIALGHELNNNR